MKHGTRIYIRVLKILKYLDSSDMKTLFPYSESILRYEDTLQLLKDELEKNYEDYHWNNPQFCKAYLSVIY